MCERSKNIIGRVFKSWVMPAGRIGLVLALVVRWEAFLPRPVVLGQTAREIHRLLAPSTRRVWGYALSTGLPCGPILDARHKFPSRFVLVWVVLASFSLDHLCCVHPSCHR